MSKTNLPIPADFPILLKEIKNRIQQAQTRAMLAVNAELVQLYWDIGSIIAARQQQEGWGAAVIPRLSRELVNELPEVKGFSERNIKRMFASTRTQPTSCRNTRQNCLVPKKCRNLRHNWRRPEKCRSLRHNCPTRFSGPSLGSIRSS